MWLRRGTTYGYICCFLVSWLPQWGVLPWTSLQWAAAALMPLAMVDRWLRPSRIILLLRNFDNPRALATVRHVLEPVAKCAGYWVTLADVRVNHRNTGYDIAPALLATLVVGVGAFVTLDSSVVSSLVTDRAKLWVTQLVLPPALALIAFYFVFRSLREARRFPVATKRQLSEAVTRIFDLARKRVNPLRLPYLLTMETRTVIWRRAVRRLMQKCDVIVVVQDDAVDSEALRWELEQARRQAQRRPVFVLSLISRNEVRLSRLTSDGMEPLAESLHSMDILRLRGHFLDAIAGACLSRRLHPPARRVIR